MRRTGDDRSPTWHTRTGIVLSLLVGAGLVASALYVPGWLASTEEPVSPPPTPAAVLDGEQADAARRQVALVQQEDDRLLAQMRAVPWAALPYVDRANGAPALVLTPRQSPYDLGALLALGAAVRVDPTTVDLTTSVLVAPGAALVLNAPDTTLRMTSTADGFTSLVGWKGAVELAGAPDHPLTVTSWDPSAAAPDRTAVDGRAYIRVVGGKLQTRSAALSDLGFWSGRTGGVALTGNDDTSAEGSVIGTTVRGGHYGLYVSDAANVVVDGSTFVDNAVDGVLLHRRSVGALVQNSTARGNGANGFSADQGSSSVTLQNVLAEDNAGDGLHVDGRPLAERPGPAGMSREGAQGFSVLASTSRSNGRSGILVWDADDVLLSGNGVGGNADGIVVRGAANRVQVTTNTVTDSAAVAIAVRDGATATVVAHNTASGAQTGVQVRNAVVDVRDNTVRDARGHAISFQGAADGSSATGNTLAGQGSSSLDTRRLDVGSRIDVAGNPDGGWQILRPAGQRFEDLFGGHPLLVLWALVFLVPATATVLGRRRHRNRQRWLYAPALGPATGPRAVGRRHIRGWPAAAQPSGVGPAASNTRVTVVELR